MGVAFWSLAIPAQSTVEPDVCIYPHSSPSRHEAINDGIQRNIAGTVDKNNFLRNVSSPTVAEETQHTDSMRMAL